MKPKAAREQDAEYITVKEGASIIKLSEVSVRRLLTRKRLRRYKAGGRTLLRRDEVLAMIKLA